MIIKSKGKFLWLALFLSIMPFLQATGGDEDKTDNEFWHAGDWRVFGSVSYNLAVRAQSMCEGMLRKAKSAGAESNPNTANYIINANQLKVEGDKMIEATVLNGGYELGHFEKAKDLYNQCYESAEKAYEINEKCPPDDQRCNDDETSNPSNNSVDSSPPSTSENSEELVFVGVSVKICGAINDIIEDPTRMGALYAGSANCGVLKSANGGRSWDKSGLAQGNVVRMFWVEGLVWALMADKGLMFSKDEGANWAALTAPEAGLTYLCGCMPGGNIIYLGTNAGLFASADLGKTWELISTRGVGVRWVACGKDPRKVAAVFAGGRVAYCPSMWSQWTDLAADPANLRLFVVYLKDLVYFLARQDGRLLRCDNPATCASAGGWSEVSGISGATSWVNCMDKACKCLGVLTTSGLYQSSDGGKTFTFLRSTEMNMPEVFTPLSDGTVVLGGEGEIRRPAKIEEKISLGDVNFETGKADLTAEARATLDGMVAKLASRPELRVRVEGHTDNVGGDDYNLDLSHRRADSVKSYLISKGITAERFETKGYGEQYPIASNDTADGKAQNRRVEVYILD